MKVLFPLFYSQHSESRHKLSTGKYMHCAYFKERECPSSHTQEIYCNHHVRDLDVGRVTSVVLQGSLVPER